MQKSASSTEKKKPTEANEGNEEDLYPTQITIFVLRASMPFCCPRNTRMDAKEATD
jgi:hypothetical protein